MDTVEHANAHLATLFEREKALNQLDPKGRRAQAAVDKAMDDTREEEAAWLHVRDTATRDAAVRAKITANPFDLTASVEQLAHEWRSQQLGALMVGPFRDLMEELCAVVFGHSTYTGTATVGALNPNSGAVR